MDGYTIELKAREVRKALEAADRLDALLVEMAAAFEPGTTYVVDGDIYSPGVLRFTKDPDGTLDVEPVKAIRACDLKAPAAPQPLRPGDPMPADLIRGTRVDRRLGELAAVTLTLPARPLCFPSLSHFPRDAAAVAGPRTQADLDDELDLDAAFREAMLAEAEEHARDAAFHAAVAAEAEERNGAAS